ncbi:MAG: ASCH domain-containing protein [Bacilli bacterium]|nr:ASCH domain-containing protein [Bacilli bacterium]
MLHEMRLHDEPFKLIQAGTKTIELRLYDEKRQQIQVGDIIEFTSRATGEVQKTKVIAMHIYSSFADLYRDYDKVSLGYGKDEEAKPEDMELYYSKEEQEKYGVVGIEIELL